MKSAKGLLFNRLERILRTILMMRMLHSLVYILFKRIATSFPGWYCPLSLQEKEKRETLGTRLIGSLPDDLKGHARDATCIIRPVS